MMSWITPELANALATLLSAAALCLAKLLADRLKLSSDSEVRAYLMELVNIAVLAADRRIRALPEGQGGASMRDAVIGEAVGYIASKAPDALKHFGIGNDALRDMVTIRLHPAPLAAG